MQLTDAIPTSPAGEDAEPSAQPTPAPETQPAMATAGGESSARPIRRRLALVARDGPATDTSDAEETVDLGPPVDAILDGPYDAEVFDDCAYDTAEEEYPCDQEAC